MKLDEHEQQLVDNIEAALERRGWRAARQSFFGRRGDVVAQLPNGALLLVDVKVPSTRVSFTDIAQLAEWSQLSNSVDQVTQAFVVLVTDGALSPSIKNYAREAGVAIVPAEKSEINVGERVIAALNEGWRGQT